MLAHFSLYGSILRNSNTRKIVCTDGLIGAMRMNSFFPKRTKFKKQFKRCNFNSVAPPKLLSQMGGTIKVIALEPCRLRATQITAVKTCINKVIKKMGILKTNIFPDTPISKKPLEIRMGKGKGAVDHWACKIQPGRTIFELETSENTLGIKAMEQAQYRLPIRTRIISG